MYKKAPSERFQRTLGFMTKGNKGGLSPTVVATSAVRGALDGAIGVNGAPCLAVPTNDDETHSAALRGTDHWSVMRGRACIHSATIAGGFLIGCPVCECEWSKKESGEREARELNNCFHDARLVSLRSVSIQTNVRKFLSAYMRHHYLVTFNSGGSAGSRG